jgi:hypothetical protein
METLILPINVSTGTPQAVQPQGMSQPAANFAKALASSYNKEGERNVGSDEKQAGNLDPSLMASLLAALMASNPGALLTGEGVPSPDSEPPSTETPPSGLPPSPNALPLPPLFSEDISALLDPGMGSATAIQPQNPQEADVNLLASILAAGEGGQGQRTAPALDRTTLSINDENQGSSAASRLSAEKIARAVQDRLAAPKMVEDGVPPKSSSSSSDNIKLNDGDPSVTSRVLAEGIPSPEKDSRVSNPSDQGFRGEKSPSPALTGGETDKDALLHSDSSSPVSSNRPINPKPFQIGETQVDGAEKTFPPRTESQESLDNLKQTSLESHFHPENPNQISAPSTKGNESGFSEGGGKGLEKFQLAGNEYAEISKKAVQNSPDFNGPFPGVSEASTLKSENLGGIKENYTPSPMRPEDQAVFQQLGPKVSWSIRNNEEKVKITLEPPELGHIYMEINRSQDSVKATLWTDSLATKTTLETNHLEIQKIIESEGFKLEKFDVFVQQDTGWFQGRKEEQMNPDTRSPLSSPEMKASPSLSTDPLPAPGKVGYSNSGYLDVFV